MARSFLDVAIWVGCTYFVVLFCIKLLLSEARTNTIIAICCALLVGALGYLYRVGYRAGRGGRW